MKLDFRFQLRDFVGKYPLLFYASYGRKLINRQLSVNKQTQLVIEGFPRCANSFAVIAFQQANPDINIAHHLHVPAQVIQGAKWKIPTLILIRSPQDAVASIVLRNPQMSVKYGLNSYINFYSAIQPYHDRYVVGKFENVITDYSQVIQDINNKFQTNFVTITPEKEKQKMVMDIINQIEPDVLKTSIPSRYRDSLKTEIITEIQQKYSQLLLLAENKYQEFID